MTPITISRTARSTSQASAHADAAGATQRSCSGSRRLQVAIPDRGHQTITYVLPRITTAGPPIRIRQRSRNIFAIARRSGGGVRAPIGRLIGAPGEIFPKTALLPRQPRTMAVWHPKSAHETEVWRWFFVDRDAPQQVKNFLRDYYIRYSGPAGMTEQDDMENWNYAHAASRGTIARRYPYSYERGSATRWRITSGMSSKCQAGSST